MTLSKSSTPIIKYGIKYHNKIKILCFIEANFRNLVMCYLYPVYIYLCYFHIQYRVEFKLGTQ